MNKIKGPAIFLAQFISEQAPFNSFQGLCEWASGLGYKAIQVPTSNPTIFDLEKAAESQAYCDEIKATCEAAGVEREEEFTELNERLKEAVQAQKIAEADAERRLEEVKSSVVRCIIWIDVCMDGGPRG